MRTSARRLRKWSSYRKQISDYIGSAVNTHQLIATTPDNGFDGLYGGYEIIQPINLGNATFKGMEFDFRQRLSMFPFALVKLRQLVVRTRQRRVQAQRLAQVGFGLLIISLKRVHQTELVVVVGHVRLNGCILQEFLPGTLQILFLVVRDSEIEVNERQPRAHLHGQFEFPDSVVIFLAVDMRFSQQEMQLGRILPRFREATTTAFAAAFGRAPRAVSPEDLGIAPLPSR